MTLKAERNIDAVETSKISCYLSGLKKYVFKFSKGNRLYIEFELHEDEFNDFRKKLNDVFYEIKGTKTSISRVIDGWKKYINALCKENDYVVYYHCYHLNPHVKTELIRIDKYNDIGVMIFHDFGDDNCHKRSFQSVVEVNNFFSNYVSLEKTNDKIMERIDYHIENIKPYLTTSCNYDVYYFDGECKFHAKIIEKLNYRSICLKYSVLNGYDSKCFRFSSPNEVDGFFEKCIKIIKRDTLEDVIDYYIEKIKNTMEKNTVVFKDTVTNKKRILDGISKAKNENSVDVKMLDSNGSWFITEFTNVDSVKEFFENNIYIQNLNHMFK